MMYRLSIFFLPFVQLFFSCANITPPSGGPKDEKAPSVKESQPKQGQLNYTGNTIDFTFDEDVQTTSLQEQLIITPYTENPYKVIQRKDKLILQFEKPLESNRTYTFNFRDGVKDITEGNISKNLSLAFSTGSYIDSNSLRGIVKDIETNLPIENIVVSLYKAQDTFPANNKKPIYFVRTDKNGEYELRNIKNDTYDIIVIEDKNKNLQYNENEKLGFIKKINFPKKDIIVPEIKISNYSSTIPQIKNIKTFPTKAEIHLKKGVSKYFVLSTDKINFYPVIAENGKVITLYKTNEFKDSLSATIQLIDSTGNENQETIKFQFDEGKKTDKEKTVYSTEPEDLLLDPKKINIKIKFNKPIVTLDTNNISLKEDTVTNKINSTQIKIINNNTITINKKTIAKDSVILILKEKAISFNDTTIGQIKIPLQFKKEEDYSSVEIRVRTNQPNYIIQILDNKYKVVYEGKNANTINIPYVKPGAYTLRSIIDENNNGSWDGGNLLKGKQPEDIIVYKNKLELRANWEVKDIVFEF